MFLFTINHLWPRARLGDVKAAGFGLKELVLVDTPKNFPPSGFQLGAVHLQRGWTGPVTLTDWTSASAPSTVTPPTVRAAQPPTDHRVSRSAGKPDPILAELRDLNRHLDTLLQGVVKPSPAV
ncbi:MAG: hypothetical protein RL077_457 [Verrucomicrobiota bacterium]